MPPTVQGFASPASPPRPVRDDCWVVIPVKAPDDSKTRLKAVLSDEARRDLVARMLGHVAAVTARAGVGPCFLLGPAHDNLPSFPRIDDPGGGLNAALAVALDSANAARIRRLIIIVSDLPRVRENDLHVLAGVPDDAIAVAPDRFESGTNALSLPLPMARNFRFRFGPSSFSSHREEADRLRTPLIVVSSPTLGLDIDLPADIAAAEPVRVPPAATRASSAVKRDDIARAARSRPGYLAGSSRMAGRSTLRKDV